LPGRAGFDTAPTVAESSHDIAIRTGSGVADQLALVYSNLSVSLICSRQTGGSDACGVIDSGIFVRLRASCVSFALVLELKIDIARRLLK
jgi:hypothetical protein